MKIIWILLLTVCIINAQYAGTGSQSSNYQYGNPRQPVPPPQPVRVSQPRDNRSIGMSYQAPPPDQNSMFIEAFMNMFFEQMKDVHMDRYETEDGVLTNVNIHVKPPTPGNLVFRYNKFFGY